MDNESSKSRRSVLQAWILGLAVFVLLAGLGWWAAESRARVADTEMRDRLLHQTSQIAANINLDLARKLTFTPSDQGTPAYECLREQLTGYGSNVPDARWLYCMVKRDDRIVFGIDIGFGDIEQTERSAKPGEIYDDASPEFRQLFGQKQPITDGPCTDKWGTFVSACVPVFDEQTGKPLMVVGLDVEADVWSARLNAARRGPILITLCMMVVLGGSVILIRWHNRHRTQDSLKLKPWIVGPTALAALAGLVIFATYAYRQNAEQSRRNMFHFTEQMRAECDRYLNSEVQLLKAQTYHIAQNRAMLKAWQDRDLATLNALAQPELEELKQKYQITHFYFIAPDRTCFLRVHQPARRGDVIDRSTMLTAVRTGAEVWGTELGALGTCTLRYVRPWKQDDKIVGYLELGIEIGHLMERLARDADAEIVTVIRKSHTTRESFEAGRQAFGFVGQWDEYPDVVVAHQTAPHLSRVLMRWPMHHDAAASRIEIFDTKEGEKQFACGVVHLPDVAGRNVADLLIIRDVTAQSMAARSDLFWSMGLAFALIVGVVALLWSVTNVAERQLGDAFASVSESAACMQAITGSAHDAILMMDPEGLISYWNPAAERILGYTGQEAIGKNLHELLAPPQYHAAHHAAFPEFRRTGQGAALGKTLELAACRKDGAEIAVALSLSAVQIGDKWHAVGILRDETEAHRQREELRASQERFAQVAEMSGEIIWEVDAQGLFTYASHTFRTLLGYDENELVGKLHFYDLHPKEGREEFRRQTFAVSERRESFRDMPNQVVAKDGRVLVMLTNGVPILNADGTLQGYRGSDKDITERKQAEETLRQQQAFLRHIIDTVPAFICVKTASGRYALANRALAEAYGTTVDRVEGHTAAEFSPGPEEVEAIRRDDLAVFESRETLFIPERKITYADGSVHWLTTTRTPLIEKDGSCERLLAVAVDITKRKQAEEALEKRIIALTQPLGDVGEIAFEDLFNLNDIQRLQNEFAEATGVASMIIRPDGTPITAPSNFCRLCRDLIRKTDKGCANCRSSDAAVGRFHSEGPVIQTCTSGGLWDAGAGITVGGRHIASWLVGQVRDETQTEAKMGEYAREIGVDEQAAIEAFREVPSMSRSQFERVAKSLFTLANQLSDAAYQNIQQARFITEHKRAEDALLHTKAELQQYVTALELSNRALREVNELAEAATRAKSEFLANMSHEIRTPMTAILGYADIMLEENVGRTTRQHVEVIKRNGKHLLEIINDILDLSKVEAGKMQIEPTRCSPVELLAEVVALMRVRADAKHLKLMTVVAGPMPETVLTDPLRLRQVLVNLVGNAIKFTDQGEVRIAARLTQDDGLPRLRIDVTDTGIGMNDEEIARLFRAFTQVDNSATRKFGGSGMGLCISKRLAEALGGTIEVHSTPGKGSTFSVMIDPGPLEGVRMIHEGDDAAMRPMSAPMTTDSATIGVFGRVLLAEDGPDNQRLICMLLRKAGADVVAVDNGQLAVETAMAAYELGEPFDIILMDMQMPVMDGYSATRRLRDWKYPGPIVALTAHAMDHDCQKCLDAGCDDYATKPINRQTLLATVAHWVGHGQTHHDAHSGIC